jgi:hypothetical protein
MAAAAALLVFLLWLEYGGAVDRGLRRLWRRVIDPIRAELYRRDRWTDHRVGF